jgi:hypothetical protein
LLLDVYCILYFPYLLGGFLHICAMYIYYICGLWPPDNVSCIFLTWYQSIGFFFLYRTRNSCSTFDPVYPPSTVELSRRPRRLRRLILGPAPSPHLGGRPPVAAPFASWIGWPPFSSWSLHLGSPGSRLDLVRVAPRVAPTWSVAPSSISWATPRSGTAVFDPVGRAPCRRSAPIARPGVDLLRPVITAGRPE